MGMKLEVLGVNFSYGSRLVLQDVTMSIEKGSVVGLVGPNGSGKTTFLKCINGILKPSEGSIMIEKREIREMKLGDLAKLLGYVPQVHSSSFPFTVFDAVLLGRRPHVKWDVKPNDRDVVSKTLALMGIENLAFRQLGELSGGEKQKVIIARALAQEPRILLLDEPTSNLDIRHQLKVFAIIRSLAQTRGMAVVVSIHDLNLASRYSDKIILLHKGRIDAAGQPIEVLTPENVRVVYGVDVAVHNHSGIPYIIPVAPVDQGKTGVLGTPLVRA